MNFKPELVLGTSEFGHPDYAPHPFKQEIVRILNLAWNFGIRTLDTADTYGLDGLEGLFGGFKQLKKSRTDKDAFYHYTQTEGRLEGLEKASVYTLEQLNGLKEVIFPLNINNTTFSSIKFHMHTKYYARSVFDRGKLLDEGYSVKDCLDFVKRHSVNGIIIGVKSTKELEQILEVY